MRIVAFILLMSLLLTSCAEKKQELVIPPADDRTISEALIRINQYLVKRNRRHIYNFVKRTAWKMDEMPSGIWFEMLDRKSRETIPEGQRIEFVYSLSLIDGTVVYSADTPALRSAVPGKSDLETGLAQALMLMGKGDSARIIVPPYLAYGNFGDSDRIPGDAILIYHVKIIE